VTCREREKERKREREKERKREREKERKRERRIGSSLVHSKTISTVFIPSRSPLLTMP
jgi:hypothetical protein